MKKLLAFAFLLLFSRFFAFAQQADDDSAAEMAKSFQKVTDSIENSFHFMNGEILLPNGIGKINVPEGYKFLNAKESKIVLTTLWGNPETLETMGMLLPDNYGLMDDAGWAFNINYEDVGFVKDDDADDINYDELLQEMQKDISDANGEREKNGYEPIKLVGWASKPYYDEKLKVLHWAKELKFGESETNTLNYDIRVLGRKGLISLNAIGGMGQLNDIKKNIPGIINSFEFAPGHKYSEFNPEIDDVAAWTIGGLVAGKVLAKAGFFVLLLKFWKVIAVGAGALVTYVVKRFRGKNNQPQLPADGTIS